MLVPIAAFPVPQEVSIFIRPVVTVSVAQISTYPVFVPVPRVPGISWVAQRSSQSIWRPIASLVASSEFWLTLTVVTAWVATYRVATVAVVGAPWIPVSRRVSTPRRPRPSYLTVSEISAISGSWITTAAPKAASIVRRPP